MIVKSYEEIVAEAVTARAEVARVETLVEAADAAWREAHQAAYAVIPGVQRVCEEPADPEVEWDDPGSEKEAAENLRVAFLGGELTRARQVLDQARRAAKEITSASMRRAAVEGRRAWEARNVRVKLV